jgi:sugar phosphate isomerase/epimerase
MFSPLSRRSFLSQSSLALATAAVASRALAQDSDSQAPADSKKPTDFQIACMTLPYSQFPLQRALEGIKASGYTYVAWGTSHIESGDGKRVPVMAEDASEAQAKALGQKCRDLGLEPVMMFSGIYPEAPKGLEVLTQRLKQAAAGGVPQVLTFGHTKGGNRELWIERFKKLGPIARDLGVLLVVKQHGGETGTGEACAEIVREVSDEGVKVNYDAGNVMDYLDVDPLPDIKKCADVVFSFCMKDHRNWPKDQDCAPGYGEIDHYRLLDNVCYTGRKMPLACENISAPLVPYPKDPAGVDALAARCRVYLETVIAGLQSR